MVVTLVTGAAVLILTAAVVTTVVGIAVGVVVGVWLVHPAKQAARNSNFRRTDEMEMNPIR